MRKFALPLVLVLSACAPATPMISTEETATRAIVGVDGDPGTLPPMKSFASPRAVRPQISNNDLALDFIELSFQLESGRELPF